MKSSLQDRCGLYLITPPQFVLSTFIEQVKQAFAGGEIDVLQLRLKDTTDTEILKAAEALIPICHANNCAFILNDRPDLAKKCGADGVHLGEDDMSVAKAREIIGEGKVIGASCYGSRHRAMVAGEEGADYVAFGAFYETKTKEPRGRPAPEMLTWWTSQAVLPCVAIGGIKPDNCRPLVEAGADFIAVVTGVWDDPDGPKKAVKKYLWAIKHSI